MSWNNRYFLLRHGKTIYQTEKNGFEYPAFDRPPTPLIKESEKKVLKSVTALKNSGARIDLIFSSDYLRTKQTAQIASNKLKIKEIKLDERLRDTNIGVLHGKDKQEYLQFFTNESERFKITPTNGENWTDVKKRVESFIQDIDKKYSGKNILIVSHGDPLWLLAGVLVGVKDDEEFLSIRYKELYPLPGQIIQPIK